MAPFDTPVAIVLFNRPRRVAELIARLRPSKPRRIFAIADGPRADREGERERCEAARAALDAIDGPDARRETVGSVLRRGDGGEERQRQQRGETHGAQQRSRTARPHCAPPRKFAHRFV